MAIFTIPVTSAAPNYRQITPLSGVDYELRIDWNERAEHWRLDLLTVAGRALARGLVLAPGVLLLARLVDDERPPGDLVCLGSGGVLGRQALGAAGSELLYLTDQDLTDARAALGYTA